MYSVDKLRDTIEKYMSKIDFSIPPVELYEPIAYSISNGGKRIRPIFVLMSCNIFSESIENSLDAAIAIEMFHNFTLVHDDIMDNALLRRNKPTVHSKWDKNRAILSGDAMLIKAYEIIAKVPEKHLSKILTLFSETAIQVCEGQQYDMNFETSSIVDISQYLEMIKLKTAVLIAAALKTGAIIGNANVTDANNIYEYGLNMGIAFQLQDDLLDTFGNENKFGKKIGGDILENKKTYLLIKTYEMADNNDLEILNKYFSSSTKFEPNEKIEKIKEVYNRINVKGITEEAINSYYHKAEQALNNLSVNNSRVKQLVKLSRNLIGRSY